MTIRSAAFPLLLLLLAACAPRGEVVLLPDPDGHVGTVEVTSAGATSLLTEARTMVAVKDERTPPAAPVPISEADIRATWGTALDAMPEQPRSFTPSTSRPGGRT